MLEAVHLTKRYASLPAVQELSFSLRPGQVLGCLGQTVPARAHGKDAHRIAAAHTRHVHFDGHNIQEDLTAYRKLLGYVPKRLTFIRI